MNKEEGLVAWEERNDNGAAVPISLQALDHCTKPQRAKNQGNGYRCVPLKSVSKARPGVEAVSPQSLWGNVGDPVPASEGLGTGLCPLLPPRTEPGHVSY